MQGLFSYNSKTEIMLKTPVGTEDKTVTVETLKEILDASNQHNLDAIMEYFSEDCTFDFPRGPEAWGQRYTGKAQVREALALTGTTTAGIRLKVRGCDLWEFREGKIIRKDSYWKIVE